MMLFPLTAVSIARNVIAKDRRRREREVELAQVFSAVWVSHILEMEDGEKPVVAHRILADMRGP
jgi:hypothetical protein